MQAIHCGDETGDSLDSPRYADPCLRSLAARHPLAEQMGSLVIGDRTVRTEGDTEEMNYAFLYGALVIFQCQPMRYPLACSAEDDVSSGYLREFSTVHLHCSTYSPTQFSA